MNIEAGRRELRNFGMTLGAVLALLFGLVLPWFFDRPYSTWPWVAAALLFLAALLAPAALGPIHRGWMSVGHWLAWINTRIILGVMYYTVITLAAMLMRIAGKDPMARRFDSERDSYRTPSQVRPPDHAERPF